MIANKQAPADMRTLAAVCVKNAVFNFWHGRSGMQVAPISLYIVINNNDINVDFFFSKN